MPTDPILLEDKPGEGRGAGQGGGAGTTRPSCAIKEEGSEKHADAQQEGPPSYTSSSSTFPFCLSLAHSPLLFTSVGSQDMNISFIPI